MKKLELKAIDFYQAVNHDKSETQFRNPSGQYVSVANAVQIAQAKHDEFMKELMDGAKVVYGHIGTEASSWSTYPPGTFIQENNTHAALLINVKEIEKKCEKHEPSEIFNAETHLVFSGPCRFCGTEIKPSAWVAK